MLSFIALGCAVVGYLLFFLTELLAFPIILIFAGFIISIVDIALLYGKEKLQPGDFIKEVLSTNWGSAIALAGGLFFIILLIFA